MREGQLVRPQFAAARLELVADYLELFAETGLLHSIEVPLDVLLVQISHHAVGGSGSSLFGLQADTDDRLFAIARQLACSDVCRRAGVDPADQILLGLVDRSEVEGPIQILALGDMTTACGYSSGGLFGFIL